MVQRYDQPCGFRISAQAQPNVTLAPDECAFATYGVVSGVFTGTPVVTVTYWGPGQTIPAVLAGFGALQSTLIGGVVFKNC